MLVCRCSYNVLRSPPSISVRLPPILETLLGIVPTPSVGGRSLCATRRGWRGYEASRTGTTTVASWTSGSSSSRLSSIRSASSRISLERERSRLGTDDAGDERRLRIGVGDGIATRTVISTRSGIRAGASSSAVRDVDELSFGSISGPFRVRRVSESDVEEGVE